MQDDLFLSLVIPTYNERGNIKPLVEELSALLDEKARDRYELIVVDDDSPDRTWEVAEEISENFSRLRVLRRLGQRGLSAAVVAGWQIARGRVRVR